MHCIKDTTLVAFFNKTFVMSSFIHDVGGNFHGENFSGGNFPRCVFTGENIPGENFPGGNFPATGGSGSATYFTIHKQGCWTLINSQTSRCVICLYYVNFS